MDSSSAMAWATIVLAIATLALVGVTWYYAHQVKGQVRLQSDLMRETVRPILTWDQAYGEHDKSESRLKCSLRNEGRTAAKLTEAVFVADGGSRRDCRTADEVSPGLSIWAVAFPLVDGTLTVHYRGQSSDVYELKGRTEDLRYNLLERHR